MDRRALKDSRLRVVGRRETLKYIQRGMAAAVYVASDANRALLSEIEEHCRTHQIPITYVDSMKELGQLCGIEVKAVCAALTSSHGMNEDGKGGRTSANH